MTNRFIKVKVGENPPTWLIKDTQRGTYLYNLSMNTRKTNRILKEVNGKLKLGKRGQFAVGHLIVGALIMLLILGLAFIYIIMPDPTDFIAGLGWLDEALVGVAAVIGSAMVLNKVVLKK